jgi:hypothetical protein
MGIERQPTLIHWNYFLALEEDLERLSRFVDFSGNDQVYSIEIARLFMSACAEVDVVLKRLSEALSSASNANSINAYFSEIALRIPSFVKFEVIIPRFGLTLHPWQEWKAAHPPFWWQHHNKVKHHRHEHFEKANLKNCLNAVAGLYVAALYLYQPQAEAGELQQIPRLFNVSNSHFGGTSMGRYGHSFSYRLL